MLYNHSKMSAALVFNSSKEIRVKSYYILLQNLVKLITNPKVVVKIRTIKQTCVSDMSELFAFVKQAS